MMIDLDRSWFSRWHLLRVARRRHNVEEEVAQGAELIRLTGLLRARVRRFQQRKRRGRWGGIDAGF
jgi:hypothetical protein